MSIRKYGRYWALYDDAGELVCICLYKKGVRHEVHDWNGWKIPSALPESR